MTLKQMNDNALANLSSGIPAERKEACRYISNIFYEGGFYWAYKHSQLFLPALLQLAKTDDAAMKPLATAAHLFWGCGLYPEAFSCLNIVINYKTDTQLSDMKRPWDYRDITYTREHEVVMNKLWRFECMLALGFIEEAKQDEEKIITEVNKTIPFPFKLSFNIYDWGDARDFCIKARIVSATAIRLKSMGKEFGWRKKPKKPKLPPETEAMRLVTISKQLIEEALPHLEKILIEFAGIYNKPVEINDIEVKRRLGWWRAKGYAVAGLIMKDLGEIEKAKKYFENARWLYILAGCNFKGNLDNEQIDPELS